MIIDLSTDLSKFRLSDTQPVIAACQGLTHEADFSYIFVDSLCQVEEIIMLADPICSTEPLHWKFKALSLIKTDLAHFILGGSSSAPTLL